jgi:hypothetical protein
VLQRPHRIEQRRRLLWALVLALVVVLVLWAASPVGSLHDDLPVPDNPNRVAAPDLPYCKWPDPIR